MQNVSPTHLANELIEKIGQSAALGLSMNMADVFAQSDVEDMQDLAIKFSEADQAKGEAFVFCAIIGSSLVIERLKEGITPSVDN